MSPNNTCGFFHGVVVSYNPVARTHEIAYEDEP